MRSFGSSESGSSLIHAYQVDDHSNTVLTNTCTRRMVLGLTVLVQSCVAWNGQGVELSCMCPCQLV